MAVPVIAGAKRRANMVYVLRKYVHVVNNAAWQMFVFQWLKEKLIGVVVTRSTDCLDLFTF